MALTEQEKKIALELQAQGKNAKEIAGYLGGQRLNRPSSVSLKQQAMETPQKKSSLFDDLGEDILQTGQGIARQFQEAHQEGVETIQDENLTFGEKARRVFARAFAGGSRAVIEEPFKGAIKSVLSPDQETALKQKAGQIGQDIINSPGGQDLYDLWTSLSPDAQRELGNAGMFLEGLADIATFGASKQIVKQTAGQGVDFVKRLRSISDDVADLSRPARDTVKPTAPISKGGLISDIKESTLFGADNARDRLIAKSLNLAPVEDIARIQDVTGNNVGEFLGRYDLIKGTPDQMVEELAKFQRRNYDRVSDLTSLIDGTYTFADSPQFESVLRFLSKELDNTTSPRFIQTKAQVDSLLNKGSFELADVQYSKRVFDEITSFYTRSGEVKSARKAADMANNMQDVRNFLESEVKAKYNVDIKELNNNVQTSRAILDAIVKRSGKDDTASLFQLGDMAIIGAGNVTAPGAGFAGLIAKKAFTLPPVQLRLAKKLDEMARESIEQGGLTPAKLQEIDDLIMSELAKGVTPDEKSLLQQVRESLRDIPLLEEGSPNAPRIQFEGGKTINQPPRGDVPRGLGDEPQAPSFNGGEIPKQLDNLVTEARKYKSADEFEKAVISKNVDTIQKPIRVFRGEGKGIGNSTLVRGKYFADSKEFASRFGDVTESTIPAGSKVFDLDKVKTGRGIISDQMLVNDRELTNYLIDNGVEYTKNTNASGVEYVQLFKDKVSYLSDIAKRFDKKGDFLEFLTTRQGLDEISGIDRQLGDTDLAWNRSRGVGIDNKKITRPKSQLKQIWEEANAKK